MDRDRPPANAENSAAITSAQTALGWALRDLRRAQGLTQKELAERAGADDTYLSQVEHGRRDIRWSTITRLLQALDLSLDDLVQQVRKQLAERRRL